MDSLVFGGPRHRCCTSNEPVVSTSSPPDTRVDVKTVVSPLLDSGTPAALMSLNRLCIAVTPIDDVRECL